MFSVLSRSPRKPKVNKTGRTQKGATGSARLRRAMGLPTILPINRWDLF